MSSPATRSWSALCRRKLAAVLCALLLITGLFHTHADARTPDGSPQDVAVLMAQAGSDNAEEQADAVPAYAAVHCICKDLPVPPSMGGRTVLQVQPVLFVPAPLHALRPGAIAPPAEPPRA